ncbi:MAG: hypothetical protein QXE43_01140 [Candidatus Aenigmatarchaeota archaeon]
MVEKCFENYKNRNLNLFQNLILKIFQKLFERNFENKPKIKIKKLA